MTRRDRQPHIEADRRLTAGLCVAVFAATVGIGYGVDQLWGAAALWILLGACVLVVAAGARGVGAGDG
jgi:peptidoglycan/LPS O-acetylase OafA/YrhL